MRALITGARGFCARHLSARLRRAGHLICGLDLGPHRTAPGWLDEYVEADVTVASQVKDAVLRLRPDLVFHLAAVARGNEAHLFRVNVEGTRHVLEAVADEAPSARVLLVGSAAEYGPVEPADLPVTEEQTCRPVGAYAQSKHEAVLAGLDAARRTGAQIVIARPFNIVGAGISEGLVVGDLVTRIKRALAAGGDGVVKVGNLESRRDFVAVEDVAEAYVRMMDGRGWGEVFNICSGEARTVREVAELLCGMAGRPLRLEVDPALVRATEVRVIFGCGAKARERFDFTPAVPLAASLAAAFRGC